MYTPLHLAAIAASALENVEICATRHPFEVTPDFATGGATDSQGRHWIVKLPLHQVAGAALEAEAALAPGLIDAISHGHLSFDVVRPRAFATVRGGGRAMVYREPYGKFLPIEEIDANAARSIGRALGELHELDPQVYGAAGVPVYDARAWRDRIATELEEVSLTRKVPTALLARWDRWLDDDELWQINSVPVHGDLDEDHVLWANGQISAMIGFGEAHVGDPAEDFVWLANSLDDDLFDTVTESYAMAREVGGDDYLLERITLHAEFALARWLLHGTRIDSAQIVDDAVAMLEELDASVAADPQAYSGPRLRDGGAVAGEDFESFGDPFPRDFDHDADPASEHFGEGDEA